MSRNNEDRMGGGTTKPDTGSPAAVTSSLSPLEFVRPTSVVVLPSGGKFYPEGHPLCGETEIEIRQMTTAEEDILMRLTSS